jgi:hypothetical protein
MILDAGGHPSPVGMAVSFVFDRMEWIEYIQREAPHSGLDAGQRDLTGEPRMYIRDHRPRCLDPQFH